ncbi:MAG: ANTAR domain-containing protein [Acidimicrobiia bacterium]
MHSRDPHGGATAPPDQREHSADTREALADQRERTADIREAVLDRWERALTERALALGVDDEQQEQARLHTAQQRVVARSERRAAADERRTEAIERAVNRIAAAPPPAKDDDPQLLEAAGARTLESLLALVETGATLADTLATIVEIAGDAFVEADAVTISLTVDGTLTPAASSATWASELDATQLRRRRGPIIDAVTAGSVVISGALAGDDRWDLALGPGGDRAVLSTPLLVGDAAPGVLTVYAHPGRRFGRHSVLAATLLSGQASLAVGLALERLSHRAQLDAWQRALASRDLIGQAKGILMQQRDLDVDAAYDLLRTTSQRQNTKVRDLAEHVVTHRRLPDHPSSANARDSDNP